MGIRGKEGKVREHNRFPPASLLPTAPLPSLLDSHHSRARAHPPIRMPFPQPEVAPTPLAPPLPLSSPLLLRPHRSFGPLLKITAPPPMPPFPSNLNGELGIAQRYGLGDSGRSAQIPLSLSTHPPTYLPTSQFPSGTEKLVQFRGKNPRRTRPRPRFNGGDTVREDT